MNKMTQAALAALAFGFCSTAVYADGAEAASFGGGGALLHKDLKCKAPLIEPNLRRNLGKWST